MRPDGIPHGHSARQRGFGLVAALFLIVVIAGVIAAMARLAATQHATGSLAIQQARAYQAARAGIEWGIARAMTAGECASRSSLDLPAFKVQVECQQSASMDLPEEGRQVSFFTITATAEYSSPGSLDYVYRRLDAVVERSVQ